MKFFFFIILIILSVISCRSTDRLNLDNLEIEQVAFSNCPDTVKSLFIKRIGPKIEFSGRDTFKSYPDQNFDFIYVNNCGYQSSLHSVSSRFIKAWFGHYELLVEKQAFMTTKNLQPPFVLFEDILYSGTVNNAYEAKDYSMSQVLTINLKGVLTEICSK